MIHLDSKLPDQDKRDAFLSFNVVRFCFAKNVETLERAAEKLCRI